MTQPIAVTDANGNPTGETRQLAYAATDENGKITVSLNQDLIQPPNKDDTSEGSIVLSIPSSDVEDHRKCTRKRLFKY